MKRPESAKFLRGAKRVAFIGLMAATLEAAKLALAWLPNVEAVTLLCAVYGYVFGVYGVISAVIFVGIEVGVFGFGSWVISYFIHWPFIALVFLILRKLQVNNRFLITAVAVLITVSFGVLTSLVDIGLFSGFYDSFWYRFGVYYMRGIPFYVTEVVCNAILFLTVFLPLTKALERFASDKTTIMSQ